MLSPRRRFLHLYQYPLQRHRGGRSSGVKNAVLKLKMRLTTVHIRVISNIHSISCCGVGWFNGPPSWAEMERVLDGKPRHAGALRRGRARRRRALVAQARGVSAAGRRPDGPLVRRVCRAACAFGVQLPRRGQHAGGAGRRGRPAGSARPRADRPQRPVRGGAVRRSGRGTRRAHRVRRRTVAGVRTPAPSSRIRPARICWCWPAARKATGGCRGSWPRRIWPAARRASCATTSTR